MKTPPISLKEITCAMISELFASEKKYLTLFKQLAEASHTEELRTAVAPESTELESQISRLLLLLEQLKLKQSRVSSPVDEELIIAAKNAIGFKKQTSLLKDIQILQIAKLIYNSKIAYYSSLQLLLLQLEMAQGSALMEQSCTENRNNFAYLIQIEQNIIYPQASKS